MFYIACFNHVQQWKHDFPALPTPSKQDLRVHFRKKGYPCFLCALKTCTFLPKISLLSRTFKNENSRIRSSFLTSRTSRVQLRGRSEHDFVLRRFRSYCVIIYLSATALTQIFFLFFFHYPRHFCLRLDRPYSSRICRPFLRIGVFDKISQFTLTALIPYFSLH